MKKKRALVRSPLLKFRNESDGKLTYGVAVFEPKPMDDRPEAYFILHRAGGLVYRLMHVSAKYGIRSDASRGLLPNKRQNESSAYTPVIADCEPLLSRAIEKAYGKLETRDYRGIGIGPVLSYVQS